MAPPEQHPRVGSEVGPESFGIRLARAHEVTVLPSIETRAATLFSTVGMPEIAEAEGVALKTYRRALAQDLLWVAVWRSRVLGFALAQDLGPRDLEPEGDLHLRELDVHPDFGRRGLGRRLLEQVVESATHRGFRRLTLTTFRQVAWNAPFYERCGFRELPAEDCPPELERIVAGEKAAGLPWELRLVMVKDLSPG